MGNWALKILFLTSCWLTFSCKERTHQKGEFKSTNSENSESAEWDKGNYFCKNSETPAKASPYSPSSLWSAKEVQDNLQQLNASKEVLCKPWSAYSVSYKAMTRERDKARCELNGALKTSNALNQDLMDGLADAMSRFFVKISEQCLERKKEELQERSLPADPGNSWCRLYDESREFTTSKMACDVGIVGAIKRACTLNPKNALAFALSGTAIYLTSHIAMALMALPHVDWVWINEESLYSKDAGKQEEVFQNRIKYLSGENDELNKKYGKNSFKRDYDSFNAFLMQNLDTVAKSLKDNGLVKNRILGLGSQIFEGSKVGEKAFDVVRNDSYNMALKFMKANGIRGNHPMVTKSSREKETFELAVKLDPNFKYQEFDKLEPIFAKLAAHAEIAQSHFSPVVLKVAGGVELKDLEKSDCLER